MQGKSKIIIVGRGGSGKDFMRKKYEKRGFKYCISCTSRPPRSGEEEGKDYKFVTWEYFDTHRDEFYEIDEFNGWRYGTLKKDFEEADLFLLTPNGIRNLKPEDRERSIIIYINPDKEIIRKRLIDRKDADSAERRIMTDNMDFNNFSDYDVEVKNHDF